MDDDGGQYRHFSSDDYINRINNNNNNNHEDGVLLPQVASKSDATKNTEIKRKGCQRFRPVTVSIISFFLHFGAVMGILFGGAMVLAAIEDPPPPKTNTTHIDAPLPVFNKTELYKKLTRDLKKTHDINITAEQLKSLIGWYKNFKKAEKVPKLENQKFIFLKWLYFAVVTTTTIGYGDIAPKTDNGKLFTIGFVVIGIILMMTLLARCGTIISATNKRFYGLLRKYCCIPCNRREAAKKGKRKSTLSDEAQEDTTKTTSPCVSDELLSVISIHLIFLGFLWGGIWYGIWKGTNDWSYIDVIYFWFVTFTTCGYGDMTYSIQVEVDNIFEHTIYRLFGLALLSAIINAIASYINYRTEIKKKVDKVEMKIDERVGSVVSSAISTPSKCINMKRIFRTKDA